jgi:hypothetical protein
MHTIALKYNSWPRHAAAMKFLAHVCAIRLHLRIGIPQVPAREHLSSGFASRIRLQHSTQWTYPA